MLERISDNYLVYTGDLFKIELLGGVSEAVEESMSVTLKISSSLHLSVYRCQIDLYYTKEVTKLLRTLCDEFQLQYTVVNAEIQQLINELEKYRLSFIDQERDEEIENEEKTLTLLKTENLEEYVRRDLEKLNLSLSSDELLLLYLILTSRLLEKPLHFTLTGTTGSGKSHHLHSLLRLFPQSHQISFTSLTGNSLFYHDKDFLQHKILVVEDLQGVQSSLYPIRELQSNQKLTKSYVTKKPNGKLRTTTTTVKGPVSIVSTTTNPDVYQDNENRTISLSVNNTKESLQQILSLQSKRDEEMKNDQLLGTHYDIQLLLKPKKVHIPFELDYEDFVNATSPARSQLAIAYCVRKIF